MKSAKPSTEISKRPIRKASTAAPISSDLPAAEENPVDLAVDPIVAPPPSFHAMVETFMTTQAANE